MCIRRVYPLRLSFSRVYYVSVQYFMFCLNGTFSIPIHEFLFVVMTAQIVPCLLSVATSTFPCNPVFTHTRQDSLATHQKHIKSSR